ncbi:unnamed protein product [Oikopleura dioica]|uniref:Uncharacterized protein n=1 Tax=Oikopleura dioica TaxID=34765 RepID=E4Z4A5_OIKDI|nr:unnamed protein product [Oikopleura dioica]
MSENGSVDEIKVEEFNNEAGQTVESGELSEGKKSFFFIGSGFELDRESAARPWEPFSF